MTKNQLRKEYKTLRNSLSQEEKSLYNERIFAVIKQLDWEKYTYVHIYLTLEKFNEPDTKPIIKWIKQVYPHIKLVVSKSDFENSKMCNFLLEEETILEKNAWGILEPISGTTLENHLLDLVFVPLLVVDRLGNRVGYGKGFYDRFLADCREDVKTVGLSFFEPIDLIEDVGDWDIKLKYCVTPGQLYEFK